MTCEIFAVYIITTPAGVPLSPDRMWWGNVHSRTTCSVNRNSNAPFCCTLIFRTGRLAVDNFYKGRGLGEMLLMDALKRSYDTSLYSVGSMTVIVDPIDEVSVKFYKKYGFILLPDSGKMFISMETISHLFKK